MERKLKLSNGNTITYNEVNGTCYETEIQLKDGTVKKYQTNDELIDVLEWYINTDKRVRIWYGHEDGRAWNEEFDVTGRIGRSCGNYKIPILMSNSNSQYGGSLLVGKIIRIDDIAAKRTIYKQGNFHIEPMEIVEPTKELKEKGYVASVMQTKDNGEVVNEANFKSRKSAENWVAFMNGTRYCK